jgi:hypothetical protein
VDELQSFYQKVVTKTKIWYTKESNNLTVEVSKRRTDSFFESLAVDLALDESGGASPFTETSIDWAEYEGGD